MKNADTMANKVARYLSHRHSLGYELKSQGKALNDFARYADTVGHRGPLTLALALEWARLPAQADPGYWARRLDTARGLAKYLVLENPKTEVPPIRMLGPGCRRKTPHIYSPQDHQLVEKGSTIVKWQGASTAHHPHDNWALGKHRNAHLRSPASTDR